MRNASRSTDPSFVHRNAEPSDQAHQVLCLSRTRDAGLFPEFGASSSTLDLSALNNRLF